MGGGSFLLTDVAALDTRLRHEVRSRLALLERLGIVPDERARVDVTVRDEDRIAIARRLAEAWPRRAQRRSRGAGACCRGRANGRGPARPRAARHRRPS